jgi:hypothetical protein
MKTLFKFFINHGNHDDSFVEVIIHICMVLGYDLLCDLLEMSNSINIGSAVATRRNLVDRSICARKVIGGRGPTSTK